MVEWESRLAEAEQQLIRDREDIMAKLDDSIVSHVSLVESERDAPDGEIDQQRSEHNSVKVQELVAGIQARE